VKNYNKIARQAGMTLIELTVVLLVLIGLAGLLIPYVSGFVTKTHDATGSSNIAAVNNAVIRFTVENYDKYPSKLDSLVGEDDLMFGKMMSQKMGTKYLTTHSLTTQQATALVDAGINEVMVMKQDTTDATFANTSSAVAPSQGVVIAKIDQTLMTEASLAQRMGKVIDYTNNEYFVLGLGDDSTITGKTLNDVPVHFAKSANMGADNAYNHFVMVFEVPIAAYCDGTGAVLTFSQNAAAAASGTAAVALETVADKATADTLFATKDTVIGTVDVLAGTAKADCEAVNGTLSTAGTATFDIADGAIADGDSQNETWTASGIKWVTATETAVYKGAAMAMGKGNFEGIGGAITGYYENTAN